MSFLSEIEKIRGNTFVLGIFNIIFLIAPGFLTIFYFYRDIFLSVDLFKLILLSVSFTALVTFVNSILFGIVDSIKSPNTIKKENSKEMFPEITMGSFLTNFLFVILIFISYIFEFNSRVFFYSIAAVEFAVIILFLIISIIGSRKATNQ